MNALRSSLCDFGLNPHHWNFELSEERNGVRRFLLNSRVHEHLRLIGWATGDRWLEMEWLVS